MDISEIACIDFEASGLASGSWPIEIGLSWLDRSVGQNPRLVTWSTLIRPEPDWYDRLWDPAAEDVHGIDRQTLIASGRPAWDVAEEAHDLIQGKMLVSDAPTFDAKWFRILLDSSPRQTSFVIRDFDFVAAYFSDVKPLKEVYAALEEIPTPHRAGPDAERLMRALWSP